MNVDESFANTEEVFLAGLMTTLLFALILLYVCYGRLIEAAMPEAVEELFVDVFGND